MLGLEGCACLSFGLLPGVLCADSAPLPHVHSTRFRTAVTCTLSTSPNKSASISSCSVSSWRPFRCAPESVRLRARASVISSRPLRGDGTRCCGGGGELWGGELSYRRLTRCVSQPPDPPGSPSHAGSTVPLPFRLNPPNRHPTPQFTNWQSRTPYTELMIAYCGINFVFNTIGLYLTKHAGAALNSISFSMLLPLTTLSYALPFLGPFREAIVPSTIVGLLVVLGGFLLYEIDEIKDRWVCEPQTKI